MNEAHLHLAINHFPIIMPIVGLLLLVAGGVLKAGILKRAAYVFYILAALLTLAAYSSGEAAEHFIEDLPGIEEKYMEIHEETAETFSLIMYLLGAVSLLGLWTCIKRKPFAKWTGYLTIILTIAALFYAKETGTTGGEIMHSEIRTVATVSDMHSDENHENHHNNDHEHDED